MTGSSLYIDTNLHFVIKSQNQAPSLAVQWSGD